MYDERFVFTYWNWQVSINKLCVGSVVERCEERYACVLLFTERNREHILYSIWAQMKCWRRERQNVHLDRDQLEMEFQRRMCCLMFREEIQADGFDRNVVLFSSLNETLLGSGPDAQNHGGNILLMPQWSLDELKAWWIETYDIAVNCKDKFRDTCPRLKILLQIYQQYRCRCRCTTTSVVRSANQNL